MPDETYNPDENQLRQLAQQSLDQTAFEGGWTTTDPESYIHGYMAGFATLRYTLADHGVLPPVE